MMAIERLRSNIDMEIIGLIADEISTARSVLSYGSGGNSSIMAMELHNRLFRLGLSVIAHSDGQMQRMTASVATPETVVIAFSISGYSPSVVDSVRISRHYGARTIAITAPGSALAQAAEILLPFSVPEDSNLYKPNSARYAMMAIVDLIAMTTAETIGPSVLEGLRRIKHSLAAVNVNDPRLPLGD
jgi:DNA-binding MurR/RpiR family transcriptional regulator